MEWISDELLFYGGMAAAGCSLLAMILSLCMFQIKKVRLNARLDAEYGERKKKIKELQKKMQERAACRKSLHQPMN